MLENAKDRDIQASSQQFWHMYTCTYIMRQANHVRAGLLVGMKEGILAGWQTYYSSPPN
jgi:hypothetical protein